ncbi:MAG: DUF2589 domain-containing protein [Flammeovirgaceae bacterium]
MIELENLIRTLQKAIIGANDTIKEQHLEFISKFFEPVDPPKANPKSNPDQIYSLSEDKDLKLAADNLLTAAKDITASYTQPQKNPSAALFTALVKLEESIKSGVIHQALLDQVDLLLERLYLVADENFTNLFFKLEDISRLSDTLSDLNLIIKQHQETPPLGKNNLLDFGKLKPKMVTIQYPKQTNEGIKMVDIKVPLITLVPLTASKVEELNMRMGLEVMMINGKPVVQFSNSNSSQSSPPSSDDDKGKDKSPMGYLDIKITPDESPQGLKKLIEGYEKLLRAQIPH